MNTIETLTIEEVAEILHITVSALRHRIHRGADVPPYIEVHGFKKKLWMKGTVQSWLLGHEKHLRALP